MSLVLFFFLRFQAKIKSGDFNKHLYTFPVALSSLSILPYMLQVMIGAGMGEFKPLCTPA